MPALFTPEQNRHRWDVYFANDRNLERTAMALGLGLSAVRMWLTEQRIKLSAFGLTEPDEAYWKAVIKEPVTTVHMSPPVQVIPKMEASFDIPPPPAEPAPEAIRIARLEQQVKALRAERDEALRAAVHAEDFRTAVLGLSEPLEPISFQPPPATEGAGETIVTGLFDIHYGERVFLESMAGVNSYDTEIANARLQRYFRGVLDLSTNHSLHPPEMIIFVLGGDSITGDIHEELAKTNTITNLSAVKTLVAQLKAGLELWLAELSCPIHVISLAGNHGRLQLKPEHKLVIENSYDTLVADLLELELRDYRDWIEFYVPKSPDAVFKVYGFQWVASHGDRIGSRGGQGFIGASATAARGFRKMHMDYASRGILVDQILIGHFHDTMVLPDGMVSGCLIGPSEYSRDLRVAAKPATQLFLSVHPRRGISQIRFVHVGAPEEGSIYEQRDLPPKEKPRYRVKGGAS